MIIDIHSEHDTDLIRAAFSEKSNSVTPLRVGLTSGCYDLFHNLHLTYLQRCRRMCDILIVGLDSDDLVKKSKGPDRPVIPEHQRINLLNALKCVDIAFIMGAVSDFKLAVDLFEPKFIFKNQTFRPQDVVGGESSTVVTVPDVFQPDSTSGIIEEIKRLREQQGGASGIAPALEFLKPSVRRASRKRRP